MQRQGSIEKYGDYIRFWETSTTHQEDDQGDDVEPRITSGPIPDGIGESEDRDESSGDDELTHQDAVHLPNEAATDLIEK